MGVAKPASLAPSALGLLVILGGAGCTGTVPPRDVGPPDITRISVFFEVDGLVRGRGEASSFADPDVTHVVVSARPTGSETILPIAEDGSFQFAIIAVSDDILEIAGALDDVGRERGDPAYVRVPPRPARIPHYVCCFEGSTGTCTSEESMRTTNECADALAGAPRCASILECRNQNREILPIDTSRIQVSAPSDLGTITVTGVIQTPGALVRMENRGQRSIGGRNPRIKLSQISDANGVFRFENVAARGDDELVIQTMDLLGNKSPEAPILVPDAPMIGVDLVGAYAFDQLDNGKVGTVALRFHIHGADGRGICPNSLSDPVLCFTGGLTHDMVELGAIQFDRTTSPNPQPTADQVNNRATEGDPLYPTQMIVLVLDNSMAATAIDMAPPRRFEAAKQLVRSLRKRDLVGVVSYGGPNGAPPVSQDLPLSPSGGSWSAQLAAIDAIAATPAAGDSAVFAGVREAAAMLRDTQRTNGLPGTIIVLAASDVEGTPADADAAFDTAIEVVQADSTTGFEGFRVYVVGIGLDAPNRPAGNRAYLESIGEFTPGGRYRGLASLDGLNEAIGDAAAYVSGAYVLLYELAVPERVGKAARFEVSATVRIPTPSGGVEAASATYEGPIRIDLADQ